ncbi:quinone oxidoreductase family protein [Aeromicrobium choanae]|uniref:NADPH2:quinone reductase n=1 Tax=Aeromicrobium choanae TaxID=1736691 RepID=A0A1T4Z323_9ACTN|nr:NADPH:quinone oxidoreductase family protein [Aeromicrobium choanae]SKB08440.1 NADPH2:quinone reductase [Aeromicrobium choanae]
MAAIEVRSFTSGEPLTIVQTPRPVPEADEVLITVTATGVNYADLAQVKDAYLVPMQLPYIPGLEVVGRTPEGDRVAAITNGGGYAEYVAVHRDYVYPIPDAISDEQAIALLVQGATAWHVLRTVGRMRTGDRVLVHAAAGGVGTLAVQLARRWGAGRVVGVASSESKRELARSLGAHATVDSADAGSRDALLEANEGRPYDLILDMVGGPTFDAGMSVLARFGRMVSYGLASGVLPAPVEPRTLMARSQIIGGLWLVDWLRRPAELTESIEDLFAATAARELVPVVGEVYPLREVQQAHEDLGSRNAVGKSVLRI